MVKNIAFSLFLIMCLIQWFVPLSMIFQQEEIIQKGQIFKFKTRPIDPTDPFRGKYVVLNFDANTYQYSSPQDWQNGEPVFVIIKEDEKGFAMIEGLEKYEPTYTDDFVEAKIRYIQGKNPTIITIEYPFRRFYMEETKAPKAENLLRSVRRDSISHVYGLVTIFKGNAALEDVMVDSISLKKVVEQVEQ